MNERVIGWNIQTEIRTMLNSPKTIRPLTSYKKESNSMEQISKDQCHSEFFNDNLTTHMLMREVSTILNCPMIVRPLTSYERATEWNR